MARVYLLICYCLVFPAFSLAALPQGFVYLSDIDPSITQELRYFSDHNFIGRPITGYKANKCILTRETAIALSKVQKDLVKSKQSLKVYDCYRPQRAVDDFIAWSKWPEPSPTQQEFFPNFKKRELFSNKYIAAKSGHTRGSTVDLTIIPVPAPPQATYHKGQKLVACYAPLSKRFKDNSIDMGTGYDCLDKTANPDNKSINKIAAANRAHLRNLMEKHGFKISETEWWHFTLINEPFPETYFDFQIE